MGQYDIAVFDVDGTLLDTTEGVLASVKYTIQTMGLEPLGDEQLRTFIGPPIQDSFARAYHLEGAVLQTIASCFRDRYKACDLFRAVPYDGIYELLENLRQNNVRIAAATYKRQDYAEAILRHFGFGQYTEVLCGADHENKLKKADIIHACMTQMRAEAHSRAVMIGDTVHDAAGARQAGIDFIGVTYGFGFRSKPDIYMLGAAGAADTPIELLPYFV